MKYKQWNRAASAPQARAAMEAAGVPPLAALTLCARGLDTPEKASAFLDAGRGQLLDPNGFNTVRFFYFQFGSIFDDGRSFGKCS